MRPGRRRPEEQQEKEVRVIRDVGADRGRVPGAVPDRPPRRRREAAAAPYGRQIGQSQCPLLPTTMAAAFADLSLQ